MRVAGITALLVLAGGACAASDDAPLPTSDAAAATSTTTPSTTTPSTTTPSTTTTSPKSPSTPLVIDAHGHLAPGISGDLVRDALDAGGVDAMVTFARSGGTSSAVLGLAEDLPGRLVPGVPFQQEDWMTQQLGVLDRVERSLESGDHHWMGEVILRHYGAPAIGAPAWNIGADTSLFNGLLDLATEYSVAVSIHHELDDETRDEIRDVLRAHPDAVVVWGHWCGRATADEARGFLEEFPGLHCDLAAATRLAPYGREKNPIFEDDGRWEPGWKALIGDMPDRFLFGIDPVVARVFENYGTFVEDYRDMFALLPEEVAEMVLGGNAARLLPPEVVEELVQAAESREAAADAEGDPTSPDPPAMTQPLPDLSVTCTPDDAGRRVNCQVTGHREEARVSWTSTATTESRGGDRWWFDVTEDLLGTQVTVFLEECFQGDCQRTEVVVDLERPG